MAFYRDIKAGLRSRSSLISRGGRREFKASLKPRPFVREEPHFTRGDPVYAEHSGYKGDILEKPSPILTCGCRAYGMNGSRLVCSKRPLWDTWRPPACTKPYQVWRPFLADILVPTTVTISICKTKIVPWT